MHSAQPQFSIIVPTRDRWSSLRTTLLSLKKQTNSSFEVIVVDAGSSEEVVNQYHTFWNELDDRFVLIRHLSQGPLGPSQARNIGIKKAAAPLITFCDDDDYWCDQNHLSLAARLFNQMDDVDILICNQRGVNAKGETIINNWVPHIAAKLQERPKIGSEGVYLINRADILQSGGQIGHLNSTILRSALVTAIDGFWEELDYEEDRDFLLRAMDRAQQMLFRDEVVSVHNIPDHALHSNASTRLDSLDRWLIRLHMTQHVAIDGNTPEVLTYANMIAGHAYRHFAIHFAQHRRFTKASRFALLGLAARPGFKWFCYAVFSVVRSFFYRERAALAKTSAHSAD